MLKVHVGEGCYHYRHEKHKFCI